MTIKSYRQGDVLLVERQASKRGKRLDHQTLALGEVTGHHHSFAPGSRVALFRPDDMPIGGSVKVDTPADLTHQEHSTITVPEGNYVQAIQVEEYPDVVRVVAD